MGDVAADLLNELKTLRKGRGVNAPRICSQIGPELRILCRVAARDDPGTVRQKVIGRLDALAGLLPEDLAVAARAALALHPEAQQAFLGDRTQWLAERMGRDARTARRRMDDGLASLAERAATPVSLVHRPARHPDDGWYIERFQAVLLLDRPTPVAIERRCIVAEEDGLEQIDALITLPRDRTARTTDHDLFFEMLYGAAVLSRERDTECRFRFHLQLPHVLRAGDRHEYSVLFRVPPNQPMRTHYVFTSPRRCDFFDLRVRFDSERLPEQVWRVNEFFPRDVDDVVPFRDTLSPDRVGELHLEFQNLRIGFGYGAQWTELPRHELQLGPGSLTCPR